MFSIFFFKQKTAYEMRISDWSSDVCSSDLRLEFDRLFSGRAKTDQSGMNRADQTRKIIDADTVVHDVGRDDFGRQRQKSMAAIGLYFRQISSFGKGEPRSST